MYVAETERAAKAILQNYPWCTTSNCQYSSGILHCVGLHENFGIRAQNKKLSWRVPFCMTPVQVTYTVPCRCLGFTLSCMHTLAACVAFISCNFATTFASCKWTLCGALCTKPFFTHMYNPFKRVARPPSHYRLTECRKWFFHFCCGCCCVL
jgi:hypothetical protein